MIRFIAINEEKFDDWIIEVKAMGCLECYCFLIAVLYLIIPLDYLQGLLINSQSNNR